MNKKIISVFCAVILMVSVFSACGKKKLYTYEIKGKERPVVTDENNEFVTNEDGAIAVYATNANGEKETSKDGEPNINYIQPPTGFIFPNNVLVAENFKIKIPDGWYGSNDGVIYKKDTDSKCYIKAIYSAAETDGNSFEAYVDQILLSNRSIINSINSGSEEMKKNGFASAEYKSEDVNYNDYKGHFISYTVYNDKGEVVHYAANFYFVTPDGDIYQMNYACEDGVGYDSSFNFTEWAKSNITFKEPVKE